MKSTLVAMTLLWGVLCVELAQADRIAARALILTASCAVMFWFADGRGVLIAGAALLLDWVARPTPLPLTVLLIPICAVLLMAPPRRSAAWRSSWRLGLPRAWRLPLVALLALVLQLTSEYFLMCFEDPSRCLTLCRTQLADATIIAVPLSVAAAVVQHAADELGLRRVAH